MSEQASFWQVHQQTTQFSELCNALYERELTLLSHNSSLSVQALQGRMKSLPHYIKRAALLMTSIETPLELDSQNATWSSKQGSKAPLSHQIDESVWSWYFTQKISYGLVVPIALPDRIILDCVDRVDVEKKRLRTNVFGWFYSPQSEENSQDHVKLLKPNKRVMLAACAGHRWENDIKKRPVIPSLRELLLSCDINWQNFKTPQIHEVLK